MECCTHPLAGDVRRGEIMARKTPIRQDAVVTAFAERLRHVRHSRGMTQRDVARLAHLTESYVSRLESGLIAPGIDLVARLARALGSSISELFPLDDQPGEAARAVAADQAKRLFAAVL